MYNNLRKRPRIERADKPFFLHIHIENEKKVRVAYGCLGNLVYNSWYFYLLRKYCRLHFTCFGLELELLSEGLIALFVPEALLLQVVAGAIVSLTLTFFTKRISKNFREAKGFTDTVDMLAGKKGLLCKRLQMRRTAL